METGDDNRRLIRIQTARGAVIGALRTGPRVRVLDDLNVVARHFVTVHDARSSNESWAIEPGPLALSKSSVLFVIESPAQGAAPDPAPRSDAPARSESPRYSRAPVRLWVGDYSIEGFVHVPVGGSGLTRLNQINHEFLAITSVSILGPDVDMASPFVAVNRTHITAAQELTPVDAETEDEPAAMSTPAGSPIS